MSDKRSPKKGDVGRNIGNSESGDFSSKEILSHYCSQVSVSTVLPIGSCVVTDQGLPVTHGALTVLTAERFVPGSCPNNKVWNNILPSLFAPLI